MTNCFMENIFTMLNISEKMVKTLLFAVNNKHLNKRRGELACILHSKYGEWFYLYEITRRK